MKSAARSANPRALEAEVDEGMLGEELHAQQDDDDEGEVDGPADGSMAAEALQGMRVAA